MEVRTAGRLVGLYDAAGRPLHRAEVSAAGDAGVMEAFADALRHGTTERDRVDVRFGWYNPLTTMTELWDGSHRVYVGRLELDILGSVLDVSALGDEIAAVDAATRGFAAHTAG